MSSDNNALIPREGSGPRLIEGPRAGQRSLYQQQVLDEDTYTDALSHIITRDFFPNLPHIHATNAYLTALTNNDPELLSSSIRRLAALAQEKEDGERGSKKDGAEERRRELENVGTPYMTVPGGRRAARTPVGARAWDTPVMRGGEGSTRRRTVDEDEYDELEGDYGEGSAGPGPSSLRARKKRKPVNRVRDDLPLDAFQLNYTSEDNASFVHIVDEENKQRREERWGWAWEAEKKAEQRRLEGEERRKMILDVATNGSWRVNADGKRLIGGLAEGGPERDPGEAWKDKKLIGAAPAAAAEGEEGSSDDKPKEDLTTALTKLTERSDGALITRADGAASQPKNVLVEEALSEGHPLNRALTEAGLPATALVSAEDGTIVPYREVTSGEGDGRGRGAEERDARLRVEKAMMGDERGEDLPLSGSGVDQWNYKAMNNLMFLPNANSKPYPPDRPKVMNEKTRQAPKAIKHANTRLPDDDEVRPVGSRGSRSERGSSPARSWVNAAVNGTPYRMGGRDESMPIVDNYALLPNDPSPSPTELPSLLTWGTLLATPRALDGSDDPLDVSGPTFRLPETKRRDELGRKLADKASRSMNQRAAAYTPRPSSGSSTLRALADRTQMSVRGTPRGGSGDMLPPSATPRRQEALTPAGKRLLQRSMGVKSMGTSARNRGAAMEKGSGWLSGSSGGGLGGRDVGKQTWTPSPARRKA